MTDGLAPNGIDFESLLSGAKRRTADWRPRTALVVPSLHGWLAAFDKAIREGLVEPLIIGDAGLFEKQRVEYGLGLPGARVIDIDQPEAAFERAVQMAVHGEIDLIVKGPGATTNFLSRLLSEQTGFVGDSDILSHIGAIKPARYHKMILISDAGVIPQPDLQTKIDLIENCRRFAARIGLEMPRVAVLAAADGIYPQMPVTSEAAALAKMNDRGQISGVYVDGPFSFDCAVDINAARIKGITDSHVAGQADVLIAPNIETANGIFRALALFGMADTGGILFGGRVPVAIGNRWDTPPTRFRSIVMGVMAVGA